jgi:hypothetical protein
LASEPLGNDAFKDFERDDTPPIERESFDE